MAWKARNTKRPHLEFRNEGPYRVVKQIGWKVELEKDGHIFKAHLNHVYPYVAQRDGETKIDEESSQGTSTRSLDSFSTEHQRQLQVAEAIQDINSYSKVDQEAIKRVLANDARDRRAQLREQLRSS